MAAVNEQVVRDGNGAFSVGDLDTLQNLMAPDVVHSVPGDNAQQCDRRGRVLGIVSAGTRPH
jgi:ketosteroid isomerase-like protein